MSAGCLHCWAVRDAIRRAKPGEQCHGLVRSTSSGPRWTGEVKLIERDLDAPLRWRKPRRVAVCFGGDLFHPAVPEEWRTRVFDVMRRAQHHTYLVLTKRAAEMRDFMLYRLRSVDGVASTWPRVWLGVSVEDQATTDERIPLLLQTPAAKRWVSLEPMLGPVDLTRLTLIEPEGHRPGAWLNALAGHVAGPDDVLGALDWVVLGSESLPGRKAGRNAADYEAHALSVIAQCRAARVPVFHKQLPIAGRVSHDPAAWPEDLRVQEFPA